MTHIHLAIDGMHCDACVRRVTTALQRLPGVRVERVAVGSADVALDSPATAGAVVAAVDDAGFSAKAEAKA